MGTAGGRGAASRFGGYRRPRGLLFVGWPQVGLLVTVRLDLVELRLWL